MAAIKPDLRSLTLYESFIDTKSNGAYTKAIGLVPLATQLPAEYDKKVNFIFNQVKDASDVVKNQEITKARE